MPIPRSEERRLQTINDSVAGNMDVNEVVKLFDCKNHPDHLCGRKSKATLIGEFMDTVTGDELTWPAFQRYYRSVAACVTESQFDQMVRRLFSTCRHAGTFREVTSTINCLSGLLAGGKSQQIVSGYLEMCRSDAKLQAQASAPPRLCTSTQSRMCSSHSGALVLTWLSTPPVVVGAVGKVPVSLILCHACGLQVRACWHLDEAPAQRYKPASIARQPSSAAPASALSEFEAPQDSGRISTVRQSVEKWAKIAPLLSHVDVSHPT